MVASVTTIDGIRTQATKAPLIAPSAAPDSKTARATAGKGSPDFANNPAATPQIANCDPIEMSICPVRMISVMPSAAISTGMLAIHTSR